MVFSQVSDGLLQPPFDSNIGSYWLHLQERKPLVISMESSEFHFQSIFVNDLQVFEEVIELDMVPGYNSIQMLVLAEDGETRRIYDIMAHVQENKHAIEDIFRARDSSLASLNVRTLSLSGNLPPDYLTMP